MAKRESLGGALSRMADAAMKPKPATPAEKHAARVREAMYPTSKNIPAVVGVTTHGYNALRDAARKVWGDADDMNRESLERWAANSPVTVAGLFVQFVNLGADAYEKANGEDGDTGRARSWESACSEYGAAAEYLAALFGLALDWPGLYPSMQLPPTAEYPNGRTEHGSTNVESVYRAFTWADEAKVEALKTAARTLAHLCEEEGRFPIDAGDIRDALESFHK